MTSCRPYLGREIMARLQHTSHRVVVFRASCFGAYINMFMCVKCYPLPCHYLTYKEYTYTIYPWIGLVVTPVFHNRPTKDLMGSIMRVLEKNSMPQCGAWMTTTWHDF